MYHTHCCKSFRASAAFRVAEEKGESKVMEIRVFKAENNKFNKTYYAVIGAKTEADAIYAVIKKKKAKKDTFLEYSVRKGVIAPYTDKLDGLWYAKDHEGLACRIVWKG